MLILVLGFGYWRISYGPVSLGFLSGPVERFVNASLDGMRLRVKDVVIERDPQSNTIHLRLRRAQLEDGEGQMIARAPRAGIGLSGAALLGGEIRPTNLEFIGPRLLIKRTLDGSFQLGFGETTTARGDSELHTSSIDVSAEPGEDIDSGEGFLAYMFEAFASRASGDSATSDLDSISISDAAVSIYDEANESFWYAPKTNLVFRRMPYGIAVLAHGNVSGTKHPWKLQLAADYVAETGRFKLSAKIMDLVPAEMSHLIFALSNLAKVQVPLNGETHMEFDSKGRLLAANASLSAGAGLVGFPGFLTESVLVDEGAIHLAYEPDSGDIVLKDSSIDVGGTRASLNGRFSPLHNDAGHLVSWRYRMAARNVSLDTESTRRDSLAIDSFEVNGLAAIEEGRLDIDNLHLSAGDSQIRLRGTFIEGPEVPAVFLRGTLRNAALPLIRTLWPPEAAPGAREWIVNNMSDGTVLDGDLAVNLTSEALAAALEHAPLPNDQLSFSFKLRNVTTRYFHDLPPIENAEAEGLLRGNDFEVRLSSGEVTLATGEKLKVSNGRFFLENLAKPATIGDITIDVAGTSTAILRLIDHEPLGYAKAAGIKPEELGGSNLTRLHVRLPMLRTIPFDQVVIKARSRLTDVGLANIFQGADINGGIMVLDVDKQGLVGKGKVAINDVTTRLTWRESFERDEGGSRIEAYAVLTEKDRERLNIDLTGFLRGTIAVDLVSSGGRGDLDSMHVETDLSKAELVLDQLQWGRVAGNGAKAAFDVRYADDGTTRVTNLKLTGPENLLMQGDMVFNKANELVRIDMPQVDLGPGNRFAISGERNGDGVMAFRIKGESFDARPFVDSMFNASEAPGKPIEDTTPRDSDARVDVTLNLDTLFFHNNEHLSDVGASMHILGGVLQRLQLTGQYANTKGLRVTIAPDGTGKRPIEVLSDDAGATMRAMNLYTRSHGGTMKLQAVLGEPGSGELLDGRLGVRNFVVRNESVLSSLGTGTQRTSDVNGVPEVGDETGFDVLNLEFSITESHIQIVDEAIIHGPSIGSTVRGSIRREDGRLNIAGTLTPAYALNSAIGNVPILGPVLTGGPGQGLFGVTFAVTGTMDRPRVTINPVSALAPGILRRFIDLGGAIATPEPAGNTQKPKRPEQKNLR